jgi:hypothetical protein
MTIFVTHVCIVTFDTLTILFFPEQSLVQNVLLLLGSHKGMLPGSPGRLPNFKFRLCQISSTPGRCPELFSRLNSSVWSYLV